MLINSSINLNKVLKNSFIVIRNGRNWVGLLQDIMIIPLFHMTVDTVHKTKNRRKS